MHLQTSWAVLGISLTLALCGCAKPTQEKTAAPERQPGAEPSGFGPMVIVEAPPTPVGECPATAPSGALLLVPEAAEWLVRIGPAQVMNSVFWSALGSPIESNDLAGLFAGLRECGVEPAGLEDVWVGFETVDENFVFIVHGPGIGQPEIATCALRSVRRQLMGESEAKVAVDDSPPSEIGGLRVIPFEDGAGYLVNPDELVLTTSAWQHHVTQLAQCMGRPAIESQSMAQLISRIDTRANAWAIGTLSESMASMLVMIGLPAAGPIDLAITTDFSNGFGFNINLVLDSVASAEQGAAGLRTQLDQLAASGDPTLQQFVAKMSIEAVGPSLLVRGWISVEQLKTLSQGT